MAATRSAISRRVGWNGTASTGIRSASIGRATWGFIRRSQGAWPAGQICMKRPAGRPDLYETTPRPPSASINFVTAHDGFTLQDLVSYEQKHNEANGEENRD